ncbi:MAG TPA: flagellar type III secretion system pore protein FliP [Steroidobacteraceae bacterium]|nr:flagellar type III secretion system pore protein FliP [Steroidobacteraceae bacterium]
MTKGFIKLVLSLAIIIIATCVTNDASAAGLPALTVQGAGQTQSYSLSLQVLLLMTAVTFLPAILLMMTSFTRIIIVLALLRQALGAGTAPPNQVLVGLSLFLTFFIMGPVVDKINTNAVQPYLAGTIDGNAAIDKGIAPLREFMINQTREADIATFVRIAGEPAYKSPDDVPLRILVPAFATSELKSAFQIGFMMFIPFVIIDLVVASVLMSMGMMMLSPMIISLPFKIMLFVLVDGWTLVVSTLASSFYR